MNYFDTLGELSTNFTAKEHTRALGNTEECKMYSHIHPSAEILIVTNGELTVHLLGKPSEKVPAGYAALLFPFQSHSYDRPDGTEYFRFNFSSSLLQSFFSTNQNIVGERAVFPVNLVEYEHFFNTVRNGSLSYYKVKGFLYNIIGDYTSTVPLTKMHVDDSILAKYCHHCTHISVLLSAFFQLCFFIFQFFPSCVQSFTSALCFFKGFL